MARAALSLVVVGLASDDFDGAEVRVRINPNPNPNPNPSPSPNPNQPAARVDLSLSLRACAEDELAPHAPLVHGAAFKDWNAIRSQGLGGHAPCRFWTRAPRKGERMFGMPRAPDVLVYVRCVGSGLGAPSP